MILANILCGEFFRLILSKHMISCVGHLELPSGGHFTLILLHDQGAME